MDMQPNQHQAIIQAVSDSVNEEPLTDLEKAWVNSIGSLDVEMLEYHRSRHRDGSWRDAYGVLN